jgi:low temperature requirement protein LtrA
MRAFDVGERHATWLELFFDLCFVAAVAALAAGLHGDPTPAGALRFAGLFVPVWWAWMGFAWYASAYDTDDAPFRLAFLVAMLAVIGLAASVGGVGGAATGSAVGFVVAFATMKLVLGGLYFRAWRHARATRTFCARYGWSNLIGAAVWLASLLVPPPARYLVWVLAMLGLMIGPVLAVRAYAGQAFDSGHITERYGLFTLIVLGESVVAVSAGAGDAGWSLPVALAALEGFGLAAAVWWIYFSFVGSSALSRSHLLSAFTWGYGHLFIFAGIAAAAVGVELAIEGVAGHHALTATGAAVLGGGIVAFLLAIGAIYAVAVQAWDAVLGARLGAAAAVAGLALAGPGVDPLLLLGLLLAVLVALTLGEMWLAARGVHRGAVPVEPPRLSETT